MQTTQPLVAICRSDVADLRHLNRLSDDALLQERDERQAAMFRDPTNLKTVGLFNRAERILRNRLKQAAKVRELHGLSA